MTCRFTGSHTRPCSITKTAIRRYKPPTVGEIVAWEGRAPLRPIIWDDRDIVAPSGLFTYGVGLTAGTSFFCEPGATLEVTGATASAAALSFGRGPASIFAALIV